MTLTDVTVDDPLLAGAGVALDQGPPAATSSEQNGCFAKAPMGDGPVTAPGACQQCAPMSAIEPGFAVR